MFLVIQSKTLDITRLVEVEDTIINTAVEMGENRDDVTDEEVEGFLDLVEEQYGDNEMVGCVVGVLQQLINIDYNTVFFVDVEFVASLGRTASLAKTVFMNGLINHK